MWHQRHNAKEGEMKTDQQQGARMLTLGERIVQAAQLAAQEHLRENLHQSVSTALQSQPPATFIAIGGADPVLVGEAA
jgi:hypothetical protein